MESLLNSAMSDEEYMKHIKAGIDFREYDDWEGLNEEASEIMRTLEA